MSGEIVKMGDMWGSTYPETGEAMFDLIEDYYTAQFNSAGFMKSAGAATYPRDPDDKGYFNALYGKYITAGMFMSDNVFTAIGAKPYQHEGVRIAIEAATYGLATADDINNQGLTGFAEGEFVGIGATTVQDGTIPGSVRMPVGTFRQPFKDLPMKFNYGLGLAAVENKDDVIARKDYLDKISKNYSDVIDKTLLRPIHKKQPVKEGVETSLNGLARLLSSHKEIGRNVNGTDIDAGMVSPYGGMTSARGDFYNYRANQETNLDSQLIDLNGRVLDLNDMRRLYRTCSVNWADSAAPNNKLWIMSNVAQDKLGALMQANNVLLNTVYVQRDFNGVKTVPGRDAGIVLNSFNNIPILQDGNINFDYEKGKVSEVQFGDITLADLDHIWMSILTPVELFTINNPAVTNILQEVNVIHMRAETRIDGFIGSGRIVGAPDDTL